MQQLCNANSLTFPTLSIARHSFIQLNGLKRREENENAQTSNGNQGDSNPGSLDCESVILTLSYRALERVHHFMYVGPTVKRGDTADNIDHT